jgi:hypothetical protein
MPFLLLTKKQASNNITSWDYKSFQWNKQGLDLKSEDVTQYPLHEKYFLLSSQNKNTNQNVYYFSWLANRSSLLAGHWRYAQKFFNVW